MQLVIRLRRRSLRSTTLVPLFTILHFSTVSQPVLPTMIGWLMRLFGVVPDFVSDPVFEEDEVSFEDPEFDAEYPIA